MSVRPGQRLHDWDPVDQPLAPVEAAHSLVVAGVLYVQCWDVVRHLVVLAGEVDAQLLVVYSGGELA